MKKALILGSAGMAGHIMKTYLDSKPDLSVIGVARSETPFADAIIDVTDFKALEDLIIHHKPDYVINCIGVLVQKSAADLTHAILINSYLPHFLAGLGEKLGFKLIHISTDCVFSGKDGAYTETAFRDGDDNYARTKALGEVINPKDLTIRTSIIGPELKTNGTGLLDWFFKQNGEIKGYSHAYWSGVTTLELAKATYAFIKQDIVGLYNLCPINKISKFDLLQLFAKTWDSNISILSYADYHVDKSLVCTRSDFAYTVPDYPVMLAELKEWISDHADYYSHYRL
jgi:dTDP-4-dehydrorhamnose reductase